MSYVPIIVKAADGRSLELHNPVDSGVNLEIIKGWVDGVDVPWAWRGQGRVGELRVVRPFRSPDAVDGAIVLPPGGRLVLGPADNDAKTTAKEIGIAFIQVDRPLP